MESGLGLEQMPKPRISFYRMSKEQYREYLIKTLNANFPCDKCEPEILKACMDMPFEPEIEWDFTYPKVTLTVESREYFEDIRRNPVHIIQYIDRKRVKHCKDFQEYLDGVV